jgi:hypothetical protein
MCALVLGSALVGLCGRRLGAWRAAARGGGGGAGRGSGVTGTTGTGREGAFLGVCLFVSPQTVIVRALCVFCVLPLTD